MRLRRRTGPPPAPPRGVGLLRRRLVCVSVCRLLAAAEDRVPPPAPPPAVGLWRRRLAVCSGCRLLAAAEGSGPPPCPPPAAEDEEKKHCAKREELWIVFLRAQTAKILPRSRGLGALAGWQRAQTARACRAQGGFVVVFFCANSQNLASLKEALS